MLKDYRGRDAERAQEALRRRMLADEYADWLYNLFPWTWWGTITFRGSPAPRAASGLTRLRCYIRDMQQDAGSPIMAAIAESYGDGGRLHFHILIAGLAHLSIDTWREAAVRRFGRAYLEGYESSGNAVWYFIQNTFTNGGELHFEGDLSRNEAGGQEALSPWRR